MGWSVCWANCGPARSLLELRTPAKRGRRGVMHSMFIARIPFPLTVAAVVLVGCLTVVPCRAVAQRQEEVADTVVADPGDLGVGLGTGLVATTPADDVAPPTEDRQPDNAVRTAVPKPVKNRYATPDPALELTDPRTYRLKWAIRIEAASAPAKGIVATGPIPMDWPEQRVRLLSQTISKGSRISEQVFAGQAAVLKFQVAKIPQGETAFVERMYEITRYRTKFSLPGESLEAPRGAPPEMKTQLAGVPPGIQLKHPKMIELTDSLRARNPDGAPWETVKSFWSWTRDNVKFENGDFRGAMHALEQQCGDCEEMSALFVGMCRLSGIPARTVWVESHDYPEFYLVDSQGKGHWIPAQVLGPAWFGEMAEYRPIFQKGDRFFDPLKREYVRYVPQTVRGAHARVAPKVQFIHEIISDSDINGPSYNGPSSRDRS